MQVGSSHKLDTILHAEEERRKTEIKRGVAALRVAAHRWLPNEEDMGFMNSMAEAHAMFRQSCGPDNNEGA